MRLNLTRSGKVVCEVIGPSIVEYVHKSWKVGGPLAVGALVITLLATTPEQVTDLEGCGPSGKCWKTWLFQVPVAGDVEAQQRLYGSSGLALRSWRRSLPRPQ